MAEHTFKQFQTVIKEYYHQHGRHDLPWRCPEIDGSFDPYKIMVSELMLQQTQVNRVTSKYNEFLLTFPSIEALAQTPLAEVLRAWNGLGYNRRAKFLHQTARQVADEFDSKFPRSVTDLQKLPGVGPNTAGAIAVYAFNQPVAFVETNIRTVFIHHFFPGSADIPDKEIQELVERTLDREQPREWYWALMDYGSHLKQTVGNLNRQSRNYAKQSPFAGSRRQIRGQVIRLLSHQPHSPAELKAQVSDERLSTVLDELLAEGLIRRPASRFTL